jgi:hypothetical protein
MGLMQRQVLATAVIVAALMAWWFPAPLLIRGELVQWGRLYENRYAPPGSKLGATALGRAFVQSVTGPMPLTEFIASRTQGQEVLVKDPAWAGIFAELEELSASERSVRFFDPALAPFVGLDPGRRYVEWQDEGGIRHLEYQFLPARDFEEHEIPAEVKFSLRQHWALILAAGLCGVFFVFAGRSKTNLVESSSAGKGLRWSAICATALTGMMLWPFVHQTVGSGFSYAAILMSGLFLLGAFVGMWLFGRQAAMVRRMIGGAHLAHFTYSPEEWTRFVHWNFGEEASEKKSIWWLIFVISVVIGLGLMAVMRDEASVWVFGMLMALMALLRVLAVGLPRLAYRRHLGRNGEVYIGEDGIYLDGSVHSWNSLGTRLDAVEFQASPLPHLRFVYSYLMVAGRSLYFFRNYVTVRVPVPSGREADGKAVVQRLKGGAGSGS